MAPWWVPSNSQVPNCSTQSSPLNTVSNPVWSCTFKKFAICWPSSWRVSISKNKYSWPSSSSSSSSASLSVISSERRLRFCLGFCFFLHSPSPFVFVYDRFHVTQMCIRFNIFFTVPTHDFSTHVSIGDFVSCEKWFCCMSYIYNTFDKQTSLFCRIVYDWYSNHHRQTFSDIVRTSTLSIFLHLQ